jgi:2-polyprenyl-3-methyl-5-hydroxy-6-metoxy-1,4-benzoquinol methylase
MKIDQPVSNIKKKFDARAGHYDNPLTAFIGERELRAIRRLVSPGSIVLDYGCGTGRTTLDLLRRGCRVTGFDISTGMLAIASAKAERAGFQAEFLTDQEKLSGRAWPVITCIGVFDYYPDPLPLFHALRACLAPGGILVITFPNALSPLGWLYTAGSHLTCPATARTPAFVRRAACQSGFSISRLLFSFPSIPPFGHTLVASLTLL